MGRYDEYDDIYGYDEEDSRNYEEFSEGEDIDEIVENLRGTIPRGDCMLCGGKMTMEYVGGICFQCSKCGQGVHEDIYYRWVAGVDFDDDDDD